MMELRPYQASAVNALRSKVGGGDKRLLLVAPTGSGKTVMACSVIAGATAKGKRSLFLAHTRELVDQCVASLRRWDIHVGTIMAGTTPDPLAPVQVASKDTLLARAVRRNRMELPPADVVVVDEAHRSAAGEYAALVGRYESSVIIGLTATPTRGDGRGLGDLYQGLVQSVPVTQLVREEYLVPVKAFAPYVPDLKGVETSGGEYVAKSLATRLDKVELIGDVVAHWKKHAYGSRTICFAPLCSVSRHIVEQFRNAGIRAEHLDGRMDIEEREAILARHRSGETTIICNVAVLCEGYDDPAVECIILYRPTLRVGSFLQMAGRVLRPHPGKTHALLLDHAGAVLRHGWPDEDREWVLESTKRQKDLEEEAEKDGKRRSRHLCPECHCMFYGRMDCPNCGHVLKFRDKPSDKAASGILTEVDRKKAAMNGEQKQRLWTSCLYKCLNMNRKIAAAAYMYKSHAGEMPWDSHPRPTPQPVGRTNWQRKVREVWPEFGLKSV